MAIELPSGFIERIKNEAFPGVNLLEALDTSAPVSVRLNPNKVKPDFKLNRPVPWCENAFYLEERPLFTLDPLFHAGSYYPQEAGSMMLDTVLRQLPLPPEPKILDLCAAPGGKSTLIANYLNNRGLLVSNEIVSQRAWILRENLSKSGYSNTLVSNNDPSAFMKLKGFFDLIIVDAPCSGEGMFRKDPQARLEWSEKNVKDCAIRQKQIIEDVWNALSPEGFLIYSTCTFNSTENEDNIEWILHNFASELIAIQFPVDIPKGRKDIGHYGIPGITETEGFFIAVIRKNGDSGNISKAKVKSKLVKAENPELHKFIRTKSNQEFLSKGDEYYLVPAIFMEDILLLDAHLNLYKIATHCGGMTRKGLIPHEDLALNFSVEHLKTTTNLNREQALHYLHGDTFPIDAPQGFSTVSYNGEKLGWIKQIDKRFNNYYPKEWRIRMKVS